MPITWDRMGKDNKKGKAMLSNTSKMPGYSVSLSAWKCKTGDKLAKIKAQLP